MGWTLTLKGEDVDIVSDADHENLRSFSRNVVKAAEAYGLGPSKATITPSQGTSDVGTTPSDQVANADKQEQAKMERENAAAAEAREATRKSRADNK
jgi:hypothetical protein